MKRLRTETDHELERWACQGLSSTRQEWTALVVHGQKVIPILDTIQWDGRVVDIGICSYCGGTDGPDLCVDWTRGGDWVWVTPQIVAGWEGYPDVGDPMYGGAQESLLVHVDVWSSWYEKGVVNQPANRAEATTYRELKNAWLKESRRFGWLVDNAAVLRDLTQLEFVTEAQTPDEFVRIVTAVLESLDARRDEEISGEVVEGVPEGAQSYGTWFLEPEEIDWHGLGSAHGHWFLRFGEKYAYVGDRTLSSDIDERLGTA